MTVFYNKSDGTLLYTSPMPFSDDIEVGVLNVDVPENKIFSRINVEGEKAVAEFSDIPIDPTIKELQEKLKKQETEITAVQTAMAEIFESGLGG